MVVLQIASVTFKVPAYRVRQVPESEKATALASYRKSLTQYLQGRGDAWKRDVTKKAGGVAESH